MRSKMLKTFVVIFSLIVSVRGYGSHMLPEGPTDEGEIREKMTQEDFDQQNNDLDALVEQFKAMKKVGMVIPDSTIEEEDLDFAVRRIKAIRAMAVHKGEIFEEKKNRIIKETRFRRRLLEESGQLPRRVVPKPEEENSN